MKGKKMFTTTTYIGPKKRGQPDPYLYEESRWDRRNSFESIGAATAYATYQSKAYPSTPYRISLDDYGKYVVDYIPLWEKGHEA